MYKVSTASSLTWEHLLPGTPLPGRKEKTEGLVLDAVTPIPPATLSALFPPVCDLSLVGDQCTGRQMQTDAHIPQPFREARSQPSALHHPWNQQGRLTCPEAGAGSILGLDRAWVLGRLYS